MSSVSEEMPKQRSSSVSSNASSSATLEENDNNLSRKSSTLPASIRVAQPSSKPEPSVPELHQRNSVKTESPCSDLDRLHDPPGMLECSDTACEIITSNCRSKENVVNSVEPNDLGSTEHNNQKQKVFLPQNNKRIVKNKDLSNKNTVKNNENFITTKFVNSSTKNFSDNLSEHDDFNLAPGSNKIDCASVNEPLKPNGFKTSNSKLSSSNSTSIDFKSTLERFSARSRLSLIPENNVFSVEDGSQSLDYCLYRRSSFNVNSFSPVALDNKLKRSQSLLDSNKNNYLSLIGPRAFSPNFVFKRSQIPPVKCNLLAPPPSDLLVNRQESLDSWNNFLKHLNDIMSESDRTEEYV